jgi:hypothetical protein
MDISAIKGALSQFLGLPDSAVLDSSGITAALTDMALGELKRLVTLPSGYLLTRNIARPEPGDYFLDLESLISDERVVIYKATGTVTATQLLLKKNAASPHSLAPKPNTFDFLVCMLQGGQAVYNNTVVLVTAPIIDSANNVAVLIKGKYKVIPATSLRNIDSGGAPGKDVPSLWDMFNEAAPDDEDYDYDEPSSWNNFDEGPSEQAPPPHTNRLNIHFDDEGFNPFEGLN